MTNVKNCSNVYRKQIFFQEFSWLEKFLDSVHIRDILCKGPDFPFWSVTDYVAVRRVNDEFLKNFVPEHDRCVSPPPEAKAKGHVGKCFSSNRVHVYLVNAKGDVEAQVQIREFEKYYSDSDDNLEPRRMIYEGEVVAETLGRIPDPDDVKYILKLHHIYNAPPFCSTIERWFGITIYKTPKRWTLKQWVEDRLEKERALLQQQCRLIELQDETGLDPDSTSLRVEA